MHPVELIDKAKEKRFKLLCTDKKLKHSYALFRFRLIGNHPYIENPVPRVSGDRDLVKSCRAHVADLIRIYAPRVKLSCGHFSRNGYCIKCVEICIDEFETFKSGWLKKKGMTPEQWREKVPMQELTPIMDLVEKTMGGT